MAFKEGESHINVKKAKAKQMRKLAEEAGFRPKDSGKRRSLGITPQVGPQLELLMAKWCPEIFFGGARGGGKSITLLLDFLQDCGKGYGSGWKGVIFRRTYPQLKQLIDDSQKFYGRIPGATYLKKDKEWIFPGGEKLEFRFLETTADVSAYQGFAYCVEQSTPVLMADGSYKPMLDVQVGDFVMTLEGARRVISKIDPYLAPCVSCEIGNNTQVHPVWHSILGASSWHSVSSVLGSDSKESAKADLELLSQLGELVIPARFVEPSRHQDICDHISKLSLKEIDSYGLCQCCTSEFCKPEELKLYGRLLALLGQPKKSLTFQTVLDVSCGAWTGFRRALSSLFDYHPLSHFCDGLSRFLKGNDQGAFPLSAYVGEHNQCFHSLDAQGSIRADSQMSRSGLQHPYVDRELETLVESSLKACRITPYGYAYVCDITVEHSNHYITKSGLCNINTWMGYDELPNWPDLEAYDLMKASLRPTTAAVQCRIRSTGNPGGIGHGPVKQRFIDPYGAGVKGWRVLEDDGKGERMFIPSSVWDNKILLNNDPSYIKRLEQSGPDHLVKAWLYGDWDIVLGAYFDCMSDANIKPMGQVPDHWFRFRTFDWGGHAPFCVHWWAVSDGVTPIMGHEGNYVLPYGAKICYREWYGCDDKDFKKGLSLDNEEIARGILKRTEARELVSMTVSDNLPFQRRGGPTIAEVFAKEGVPLVQGDTDRISGCSSMYLAIKGGEARVPMMYFMDHCKQVIRQIYQAQKDPKMIEVYEQTNDDHAIDSCFSENTLVMTPNGDERIADIKEGDLVIAGDGKPRPVSWSGLTKQQAIVYRLTFDDGSTVVCTEDHKFLTDKGWVEAISLYRQNVLTLDKTFKKCKQIMVLEDRENVYCLTEPITSSFVLANTCIVHNCKLAAKIREYVQKPAVVLPDEQETLHNSIIARPTWNQIMDTHFTKIKQARDPYGL